MQLNNGKWISASQTRNSTMNSCLIDWLDLYGLEKGFQKDEVNNLSFETYIKGQGNNFETLVINIIKQKCNLQHLTFVEIQGETMHQSNEFTLEAMNNKIDVIYQPCLVDEKNFIFGHPDLLIKESILKKLGLGVQNTFDQKNTNYVVIDIKFSTLKLKKNGCLSSYASSQAFMVQVDVYNELLSLIQTPKNSQSYIIGRSCKYIKQSYNTRSCTKLFQRLGIVKHELSLRNKTQQCINWIRKLRTEGNKWTLYPQPSQIELYPNMKIKNENWASAKKDICDRLDDITTIWHCGPSKRLKAFHHQVFEVENLSIQHLEFKSKGKLSSQIAQFISNHKQRKSKFANTSQRQVEISNCSQTELFVDFEVVTSIRNIEASDTLIYLIGFSSYNNHFLEFDYVCSKNFQDCSEKEMIEKWFKKLKMYSKPILCYHYNFSEPMWLRNSCSKYNLNIPKWITWKDLYKNDLLKEIPELYYEVQNYKLKHISDQITLHFDFLYKNNPTSYLEEHKEKMCVSGDQAMILAIDCEKKSYYSSNQLLDQQNYFNEIIKYNQKDCESLFILKCFFDIFS